MQPIRSPVFSIRKATRSMANTRAVLFPGIATFVPTASANASYVLWPQGQGQNPATNSAHSRENRFALNFALTDSKHSGAKTLPCGAGAAGASPASKLAKDLTLFPDRLARGPPTVDSLQPEEEVPRPGLGCALEHSRRRTCLPRAPEIGTHLATLHSGLMYANRVRYPAWNGEPAVAGPSPSGAATVSAFRLYRTILDRTVLMSPVSVHDLPWESDGATDLARIFRVVF